MLRITGLFAAKPPTTGDAEKNVSMTKHHRANCLRHNNIDIPSELNITMAVTLVTINVIAFS